jgi:tRNA threonylcarbamoyl adenosine modification protein (Sua5/YciO/YrdC/YwlC family)
LIVNVASIIVVSYLKMQQYPTIYTPNKRALRQCKRQIASGGLVAFPTETVYGLGADGLNPDAVNRIFEWKGRPNNNPIILHFSQMSQLLKITNLTQLELDAMQLIAKECWPGPLTLVLRASDIVPKEVTAGKSFVGVRMPNDSVALALINECSCLIAAPSANISGHCSPYTPQHVANDFHNRNLVILDDSENRFSRCGIESSVIKLEENVPGSLKVTVLRTGLVGGNRIKRILEAHNVTFDLEYYVRLGNDETAMDCPGQLFRHYAPTIPAYIENSDAHHTIDPTDLYNYVIIGANGSLNEFNDKCLIYYDLGASIVDVAKNIYSVLRLAEKVSGAKGIIISVKNLEEFADQDSDLDKAITDKLLRCSEGCITRIG